MLHVSVDGQGLVTRICGRTRIGYTCLWTDKDRLHVSVDCFAWVFSYLRQALNKISFSVLSIVEYV